MCDAEATTQPASIARVVALAHRHGVQRLVLFLPGYSTTYEYGVKWAGRLQTIFGPSAAILFVDWGAHGKKIEYVADALQARKSAPAFVAFLTDLHRALSDRPIDVFAHSMGSRIATRAMALLQPDANGKPYVPETVLAAPDVDLSDYRRAVARNPKPFGRVTIYVSRYDKALALSSFVHLHHRLGQLSLWRSAIADTVVVDASAATRVGIGHGYALADPAVVADIALALAGAPIPHPAWRSSGLVWALQPALAIRH